jgi:plasmid stabilization system protein ParE
MTPRLFLRKAARADIAEAFRWYEERSPGLGHDFLRAVRVALAAIERAPGSFAVAIEDIRKVHLRRFPYVVYYVPLTRGISVVAVVHGRRHPRRWQSRR